MSLKNVAALSCIALVLSLIVYDSKLHFDKERILIKRKHNSGQRHWNLFYGQNFVFYDSAMRYQHDLTEIKKLIEPSSVVLSDLATSYYLAGSTGAYVRNVHQHQGRNTSYRFSQFLNAETFCYLNTDEHLNDVIDFLKIEFSNRSSVPTFRYIALNNDSKNKNVRSDCIFHRRNVIEGAIKAFSSKVYSGDFLDLYLLDVS